MLSCSDELKQNVLSKSGSQPVARIRVYPITGHIGLGLGLSRTIQDGVSGSGDVVYPPTGITDLSPQIFFSFGSAPPLGVTPMSLTDQRSYLIKWDGFFLCKPPIGSEGEMVTYEFAYTSTGTVNLQVDGNTIANTSSANQLHICTGNISLNYEKWIPIQIVFSRSGISTRRLQDERLVLFWRDSVDLVWKIVDASVTNPTLFSFENLVGTPVTVIAPHYYYALNVQHTITIHDAGGGNYHFHSDTDVDEHPLTPGATQAYDINSDDCDITWNTVVSHGDSAHIFADGFAHPVTIHNANNIEIDHSSDQASTLQFSCPVTMSSFSESNITRTNETTYVTSLEAFGAIRKNRLVTCEIGAIVSGSAEYVTRFTGMIADIMPKHSVGNDGSPSMTIEVTAIDVRSVCVGNPVVKSQTIPIGNSPARLDYDIAQIFPEDTDTSGPNPLVHPPCWDRWNLAKVIRTTLIQNNFLSNQLWGKDEYGNYLIDDRELNLESGPGYPYEYQNEYGTKTGTAKTTDYEKANWNSKNPYTTQQITYLVKPAKNIFGAMTSQNKLVEKSIWTSYSSVVESPYLYSWAVDDDPWEQLQEICTGYGLRLFVNNLGLVELVYPDNPLAYFDDSDPVNYITYDEHWIKEKIDVSTDTDAIKVQPLKGYCHKTTEASIATINFTGVGLKVFFARISGESKVQISIDGTLVNGVNVISTTGDVGHSDWWGDTGGIAIKDISLDTLNLSGCDIWYYNNGILPNVGKNPGTYTIASNLVYGAHEAIITYVSGTIAVEGFACINKAIDNPVHAFTTANISQDDYTDGTEDLRNDFVILGNPTGSDGADTYITSRATDPYSIGDSTAPNFIGTRKTSVVVTPKVNQQMADWLAQYLLLTYRRGTRRPNIATTGIPFLTCEDCVSIKDTKVGLYDELAYPGWHNSLYFLKFWIKSIRESYKINDDGSPSYTMQIGTSSMQPLPGYILNPEPDDTDYTEPLVMSISIDGGGIYNPYSEDFGKYANIDIGTFWACRSLSVRVIAAEFLYANNTNIFPSQVVNVLFSKTGFIPSGRILLHYDGWLVNPDGTGSYAPDGLYAIEVQMERYSTSQVHYYRSDSYLPNVLLHDSLNTITIDRDSSIYPSPRWSATNNPSGVEGNHAKVYDNTNSGKGVEITLTLNCPTKVYIRAAVKHFFLVGEPPAEINVGQFTPIEAWQCFIPGEADAKLLDSGNYVLHFNPVSMITKDGGIMPFRGVPGSWTMAQLQGSKTLGNNEWWCCWHVGYEIMAVDKAGVYQGIGSNYLTWGGPSESLYAPSDMFDTHDELYSYTFYRIKAQT